MSFFVPRRVDAPELLDEHDAPRADMERSLRDLRRINRYMGGTITFRRLLRLLTGRDPRTVSILDLGSGSSDLLEAVGGRALHVAVDFKIDHLLYGRMMRERNGNTTRIALVVGDASKLPFRHGSVDTVTSAHFIHHFSPDENAAIFRDALRVARIGLAVNDTERHRLPLLWVQILAALRLVGRITRSDAPGSVVRGYTSAEVRSFASKAGASRLDIVNMTPYRIGILLWK